MLAARDRGTLKHACIFALELAASSMSASVVGAAATNMALVVSSLPFKRAVPRLLRRTQHRAYSSLLCFHPCFRTKLPVLRDIGA